MRDDEHGRKRVRAAWLHPEPAQAASIDIVAPPWELQEQILRAKCAAVDDELLVDVLALLKNRGSRGRHDSTRDMLSLAQYAQKLKQLGVDTPLARAAEQVLEDAVA